MVLSSGGIDKLAVYSGLGVPEVWFWRGGRFQIYHLDADGYAPRDRSAFLPDLDLALLASFVGAPKQNQAVRAFRDLLRAR